MTAYPDTSFLCALYVPQDASEKAIGFYERQDGPLVVSALGLYELRQALRFQAYRHSRDRTQGYPRRQAEAGLAALQRNLAEGALTVAPAAWAEVHQRAELLSARHTLSHGHRAFDILHVATALHLGARQFLTFGANQRRLAQAEGLKTPL